MAVSQHQLPETVEEALQGKYEEFINTVKAGVLIPGLFTAKIIDWNLKEQIEICINNHGLKAANTLLMDNLILRADREMIMKLCDIMDNVQTDPKMSDLSKCLREDLNRVDSPSNPNASTNEQEDAERNALLKEIETLHEEIHQLTKVIWGYLL